MWPNEDLKETRGWKLTEGWNTKVLCEVCLAQQKVHEDSGEMCDLRISADYKFNVYQQDDEVTKK